MCIFCAFPLRLWSLSIRYWDVMSRRMWLTAIIIITCDNRHILLDGLSDNVLLFANARQSSELTVDSKIVMHTIVYLPCHHFLTATKLFYNRCLQTLWLWRRLFSERVSTRSWSACACVGHFELTKKPI